MRARSAVRVTVATLIGLLPLVSLGGNLNASEDECDRIAHWRTYSNATYVEEAGDVVGYEMALQPRNGTSISARVYIYEGVPEEGISVSGQLVGRKLTMEGHWVQHLIEHPSKKQIVHTQLVRIDGTLDPAQFRGTIEIEGDAKPTKVRLSHVDHIWTCKR